MRTSPLPADFIHARACKPICEKYLTLPQQVMGHADFSTTMDIYTHITQENMREKAEAIKGNLVLM